MYITEKYFDMNKKQCRDALDLYKKFLIRMDRVGEFLKVAEVIFYFIFIYPRDMLLKLFFYLHIMLYSIVFRTLVSIKVTFLILQKHQVVY